MDDEKDFEEGEAREVDFPSNEKEVEPDAEPEDEEVSETEDEDQPELTETESEPEEAAPAADPDDELIELADGTKVTFAELTAGYMKDADYRRKTAEIAEMRRQYGTQPPVQRTEEKRSEAPAGLSSKYDPKGLEEFKALAKELGFMSREDLDHMKQEERKNEIINGFFAAHPEYKPENDPGDIRYSALREELSIYNLNDVKNLPKVLDKAHSDVSQKFMKPAEKAKALAVRERVKAATIGSKSGGVKSVPTESDKKYTDIQIQRMKEMGVYDEE